MLFGIRHTFAELQRNLITKETYSVDLHVSLIQIIGISQFIVPLVISGCLILRHVLRTNLVALLCILVHILQLRLRLQLYSMRLMGRVGRGRRALSLLLLD